MVNVLFFGKFLSTGSWTSTSTANNMLSHSISELVAYQINRALSNLIPNLNARPIFQPGTDGTNGEYGLELGGSFFNGKLLIRTSLGYIEANATNNNNLNNQFLGDVLVEYRFKNNAWKAKGFNTTNQQDLMLYNARYSQGVGLSYSKDFDKVKELFRRKKEKEKKGKEKK